MLAKPTAWPPRSAKREAAASRAAATHSSGSSAAAAELHGTPVGILFASKTNLGLRYIPDLPTDEVYTSPDRRRADGVVRTTRPVALTSGTIVRNLELVLRDGAIVQATATHGEADLHAELDAYEGARHLGEIALVDHRSRVGELDTLFYNLLLDENATCHIAYGASILGTYEDLPEGLSDDELRGMGVNRAHVHTDLMIGGAEVEVDGLHAGGDAVPLLRGGNWQLP